MFTCVAGSNALVELGPWPGAVVVAVVATVPLSLDAWSPAVLEPASLGVEAAAAAAAAAAAEAFALRLDADPNWESACWFPL